jgi:hypothetical protein
MLNYTINMEKITQTGALIFYRLVTLTMWKEVIEGHLLRGIYSGEDKYR